MNILSKLRLIVSPFDNLFILPGTISLWRLVAGLAMILAVLIFFILARSKCCSS